eukprot:m.735865 g.735865  ORF g.735865 m.735865 type:complete len:114 (-) comp58893_c0_seq33:467-808(-)
MAGFGQETRQHQAEPEAEERLGVPPQYYMERREHDHSLQFHASNISSMMKRVLENTCRMFCFHEGMLREVAMPLWSIHSSFIHQETCSVSFAAAPRFPSLVLLSPVLSHGPDI